MLKKTSGRLLSFLCILQVILASEAFLFHKTAKANKYLGVGGMFASNISFGNNKVGSTIIFNSQFKVSPQFRVGVETRGGTIEKTQHSSLYLAIEAGVGLLFTIPESHNAQTIFSVMPQITAKIGGSSGSLTNGGIKLYFTATITTILHLTNAKEIAVLVGPGFGGKFPLCRYLDLYIEAKTLISFASISMTSSASTVTSGLLGWLMPTIEIGFDMHL